VREGERGGESKKEKKRERELIKHISTINKVWK